MNRADTTRASLLRRERERGGKRREAKEKVEIGERLKSFHGQRIALGRRK